MVSIAGNQRAAGRIYNVGAAEVTSILGCMRMMAKAVGVEPEIVSVPMPIARRAHPPLLHWGEGLNGGAMFSIDRALADLDWKPQFGLEAAYREMIASLN